MIERIVLGDPSWVEHSASHVSRYLLAGQYVRGRRVLDAGCGVGYGAALLAMAGAAEVAGVDIDAESVRLAQQRFVEGEAKFSQLRFLVDDCQQLAAVASSFDVICNFDNIEHLADPQRFLRRACQLLAQDGLALISTPDRAIMPPFVNGHPRNEFHLHEWNRDEFREMLAAHFAEVDLRTQVESTALKSRKEALAALRQSLMWTNPLVMFLWRKWPWPSKQNRPWKRLAGLAAATIADYPIVPYEVVPMYGRPFCHFAICRGPKQ